MTGAPNSAGVSLKFLAPIVQSKIPLIALSGPSLAVCSASQATEDWFSNALINSGHHAEDDEVDDITPSLWWCEEGKESEVGLLLEVQGQFRLDTNGPLITEVVVIASTAREPGSNSEGVPTPPKSETEGVTTCNIYLHALPISAERLAWANSIIVLGTEASVDTDVSQGRFITLESSTTSSMNPTMNPTAKKRKDLGSLFDDAAEKNKRIRRRGGESISEAMAGIERPAAATPDTQLIHPVARKQPNAHGLLRSQSVGSLRDLDKIRPQGRQNTFDRIRRSGLSRVASVSATEQGSPSPVPETLSIAEQQNKNALIRIIMAGMRMYGLQQKKVLKHAQSGAVVVDESQSKEGFADEKDEYKVIYHQTYKAAACALRKHMAVREIAQEAMRELVDRLLAIFCTDPLENASQTAFQMDVEHNPFDEPSQKAVDEVEKHKGNQEEISLVMDTG
jgi:hypothetical protein